MNERIIKVNEKKSVREENKSIKINTKINNRAKWIK